MQLNFLGNVINGKLELDDKQAFLDYAKSFEGKRVTLSLDRFRKQRSGQQNSYYWGVVIKLLCDETGYEKDEMHDALKMKFLYEPRSFKGIELPTIKSTPDMATIEFKDFVDRVIRWAAIDLHVRIPDPDRYFKTFPTQNE